MISEYMHLNNLQVLESLEVLEKTGFIKAIPQQPEVLYEIIQQKLASYVKQQISPEKWRILHSYVAGLWENDSLIPLRISGSIAIWNITIRSRGNW